jgi:Tfp pilus assembly PilM family ATPase
LKDIRKILDRIRTRRNPTDVVGIDVAGTDIKAVRMRLVNGVPHVVAADALGPLPEGEHGARKGSGSPIVLPKPLHARYASLAVADEAGVIKLLTFPGHFDEQAESQLASYMGVENPAAYRIAYKVLSNTRTEARVLAAAIPDEDAASACRLFPHGTPAPFSVELASLAALTAFLHGPAAEQAEGAVGLIEFGSHSSTVAFFYKGLPALFRRLDTGGEQILQRIQEALGVDAATAEQMLSDGSFDVSQFVSPVLAGFLKQLAISRDFVERRENCRVSAVYAGGRLVQAPNWVRMVQAELGSEISMWDPFEKLAKLPNAVPERLSGSASLYAAAVGAALATLEAA